MHLSPLHDSNLLDVIQSMKSYNAYNKLPYNSSIIVNITFMATNFTIHTLHVTEYGDGFWTPLLFIQIFVSEHAIL